MASGVTSPRRTAHALQLTSLVSVFACVALAAASTSATPAPVGGAKAPAPVGGAKAGPVGGAKPGVGVAVAQPAHAGAHHGASSSASSGGLDGFQTGMVIGFVTFAVLALCMMLLVLYLLVRGPRRELREARVELAELRRQRRCLQSTESDRLQLGPGAACRTSELRCMVNGMDSDEDVDVEDDSCEDLVGEDAAAAPGSASTGGYAYRSPPSPAYDNYTYVAMPGTSSAQRSARHASQGRGKKARVIIEN